SRRTPSADPLLGPTHGNRAVSLDGQIATYVTNALNSRSGGAGPGIVRGSTSARGRCPRWRPLARLLGVAVAVCRVCWVPEGGHPWPACTTFPTACSIP